MKKKPHQTAKYNWKSGLILFVILSPLLILVAIYNFEKRKEALMNNSIETLAVIEHLSLDKSKGTTSRQDVVYYRFQFQDKIIHTMEGESSGFVNSLEITTGDIYKIKVVKTDSGINEIDYSNRIDTALTFDHNLKHQYQSTRHRKIVSGEIEY